MSSLPRQTRFRLNVSSASYVVVLFGLLLMKFATSAPIATSASLSSENIIASTTGYYSAATAPVDSSITLFEDSDFKGIRSRLYVGLSTCVNLIGKLNDFFSSVDTMGGCYLLCEHQNCRGKCERVTGRVRQLSRLGLNDRVSSLKICGDDNDKATESRRRSNHWRDTISSSPSPVFLRRRLRRSVKLKKEEEREKPSSSFSSNLSSSSSQWRTKRRWRTVVDDHHHRHTSSEHYYRTVMPSSVLNPSPIKNLTGTEESRRKRRRRSRSSDEEEDSGVIVNRPVNPAAETSPRQRLLRIPRRHRRKRKGLIVRK